MVIYNLLGKDAETAFSQQWVISWALDNAQQWQEIVKTAVKAAILLYLLDRLRIISDVTWFGVCSISFLRPLYAHPCTLRCGTHCY